MKLAMRTLVGTLAVLLLPLTANAQVSGSKHDFTGEGWSGGEICKPCHIPHNASTTVAGAPLWNHAVTTATFTVYASPTFDATPGQPSGTSLLCLSCHDGTVALDDMLNGGAASPSVFINSIGTGSGDVGTDLSNDHPISFTYDAALVLLDPELADPTISPVSDLLFAGQMECASCHDVHRTGSNASLLRISNAGSALCLTCHLK